MTGIAIDFKQIHYFHPPAPGGSLTDSHSACGENLVGLAHAKLVPQGPLGPGSCLRCAVALRKIVVEMGLYWWERLADETGMSGAGIVGQVVVYEDGAAVLRWLRSRNTAKVGSTVIYDTISELVWVHGHGDRQTGRLVPVASDPEGKGSGGAS